MATGDPTLASSDIIDVEGIADRPGGIQPNPSPDVFISYRLDPDQATAIALRRLIEGSLEPAPEVFVSGAGGLRPSNIGLRPQLQTAVASARAFVAVITPQSKDREWVIFEAGAAWGRGQLYSPVLLDTEPEELGSTINDFVATRADSRDQMENLVRELAKTLGVAMKTHFGVRFSAFERHLDQRKADRLETKKGTPIDRRSGAGHAFDLWQSGKRTEALEAFERAEAEATSDEERADVKITRLSVEYEGTRLRDALDRLGDDIQATASWALWRGIVETNAHIAIKYFDYVIAATTAQPIDREFAIRGRIERLFHLGKEGEATTAAIQRIESGPAAGRWPIAAILWEEAKDLSADGKLLLAARAFSHANEGLLRRLSDLALDENWVGLAIFSARRSKHIDENQWSLNMLGRAYHAASLMSLAHDEYRSAITAGTSVARVNLALCLTHSPSPGAALAVLREHKGDYDSVDVAFPYQMRADIEKAVAAERKTADAKSRRGFKIMMMLTELMDDPARENATQDERQIEPTEPRSPFSVLTAVKPLNGVFVSTGDNSMKGFFVPSASDALLFRGVTFDTAGEIEPTWTTLRAKP